METFSALLAICAGNSPVPVISPHKGQWRGALMFSLISAWMNGKVNNREAGDLRRYLFHYDVIVMMYFDFNFTEICLQCPTNNNLALVQEMAWCRKVDKTFESTMAQFTEPYIHSSASMRSSVGYNKSIRDNIGTSLNSSVLFGLLGMIITRLDEIDSKNMMTSWLGNTFCITNNLWRESARVASMFFC